MSRSVPLGARRSLLCVSVLVCVTVKRPSFICGAGRIYSRRSRSGPRSVVLSVLGGPLWPSGSCTLFSSPVEGKHCLGFLQLKVLRSSLGTSWKEVLKKTKLRRRSRRCDGSFLWTSFFCDRKAPTDLKKFSKLISVQ